MAVERITEVVDLGEVREYRLAEGLLEFVGKEFSMTPNEIRAGGGGTWRGKAIRRFLELADGNLSSALIISTLNKDRTTITRHWQKLREEQARNGIVLPPTPREPEIDSFFSHPTEERTT